MGLLPNFPASSAPTTAAAVEAAAPEPGSTTIYIGNVAPEATEADVRAVVRWVAGRALELCAAHR